MTAVAKSMDRQNNSVAFIGTVLIHGLILLILFLYIIVTPIPPFPPAKTPEVEVALDFGNNVNGSGAVEQNKMGNNPATNSNSTQNSSRPAPQSSAVVTDNAEENPTMKSPKNPAQTNRIDSVSAPAPKVSAELAAVENKFKHSKGQPGGNGNANEPGNAGNPNGTNPGTSNGNGGPFNFSLNGRSLVSHPLPVNVSQDEGTVVVEITVDQNGTVIDAVPGARGSTTTSPYLYKKAKEAALGTRFTTTSDMNTPEQKGTMTIKFELK
jgi:periplasmic protein TonB